MSGIPCSRPLLSFSNMQYLKKSVMIDDTVYVLVFFDGIFIISDDEAGRSSSFLHGEDCWTCG